jgi:cytochrome c oxidase subunit IV
MAVLRNPATTVWATLVLATCTATWWLSTDAFAPALTTVAIILIAALKIRLVMRHFMEVRHAPLPWRLATDVWLFAVTGVIVGFYVL